MIEESGILIVRSPISEQISRLFESQFWNKRLFILYSDYWMYLYNMKDPPCLNLFYGTRQFMDIFV